MLHWQLTDSGFPTGSFAHSAGLEAAWQSGEIVSEASLERFVHDSLWQAGHGALPLLTCAHQEPARLEELDAISDAFLTNAIANRGSRTQGRAWVAACVRVWPSIFSELSDVARVARRGFGHQAPIVGAACRVLGVPLDTAQQMFLFAVPRTILAAAVRLGVVGPYRAQRMQFDSLELQRRVHAECADLTVEQICQTAPVLDVLQSTHDRLYSRLFQS
jgi:urease accessory protein